MLRFVGLDASQKLTIVCVVDEAGGRVWRSQCATDPEHIERVVRRHAGDGARVGLETGSMTLNWCTSCAAERSMSPVLMPGTPARRSRCRSTRPTRTMLRAWRRSCARDGIGLCT